MLLEACCNNYMKGKKLRFIALLLTVSILIIYYYNLKNVNSIVSFFVLSALIVQGVKTVLDFSLGLPMTVGYSNTLDNNPNNKLGRLILLITGVGLMSFSIWWLVTKQI